MKVRIEHDTDPMNPREWDNLGRMICFHKRYNLGDETDLKHYDFENWDDLENHLREEEEAEVVLPLYLYDHSGITMSTSPFSCGWDSGQVGFIFATKEDIQFEYHVESISEELRKEVEEVLKSRVKVYDQFLAGDIWGFIIEDDNGEELESCWGLYGRDLAEKEAQDLLTHLQEREGENVQD